MGERHRSTDSKRLGIGWGSAGGTTLRSVDETRRAAVWAQDAGFDSFWVSHAMGVDPMVALAAIASDIADLAEVGSSVVPLYGRHPIGLAQQVMTAQTALDGRFTLGIGPSHARPVGENLGMRWDRPLTLTKEFLAALEPLLAGQEADVSGAEVTARATVGIDAPPTPILVAALGPRMLDLAGREAQGTTVGQCGPQTIARHIAPRLHEAAEAAGKPNPRLVALVRICVGDPGGPAYDLAQEVGAFYRDLPSYAAMLALEGLSDPADLHLIGSWEHILDGLGEYAEAGVTDLRIEIVAPDLDARESTRAAIADYLG